MTRDGRGLFFSALSHLEIPNRLSNKPNFSLVQTLRRIAKMELKIILKATQYA